MLALVPFEEVWAPSRMAFGAGPQRHYIVGKIRNSAMPAATPAKPKPAKLGAEKLPPETLGAQAMVADAQAVVASAKLAARSARTRADEAAAEVKASKAKLAGTVGKLGAEKMTPEEQRRRFEELAREAGCDERSDARFEAAVRKIGKAIPSPSSSKD